MNADLKHCCNEVRPFAPHDGPDEHAKMRWGDIEIDFTEHTASVAGTAVSLTNGEFALLMHFLGRANRLLTRSELLAKVWSMPSHAGSNVVDVVVCRLRRRLGPHGRMIETVRGLGYRFRMATDTSAFGRQARL
jgi:two-component system, OmpR family, response regulator